MGSLRQSTLDGKSIKYGVIKITRVISSSEFLQTGPGTSTSAPEFYRELAQTKKPSHCNFGFSDFVRSTSLLLGNIEKTVFLYRGELDITTANLLWENRKWFILFHAWFCCLQQPNPLYNGVEKTLNFAAHIVAYNYGLEATIVYKRT